MTTNSTTSAYETDVLIIGAGPYGICLAAHLQDLGSDYLMVGELMGFWKNNMPDGMYLRSACDWHLDVSNRDTMEHYLELQNLTPHDVEPLSLAFYLSYVDWFLARKSLNNLPEYVKQLDKKADGTFTTLMENGDTVHAQRVVLAVGFKYFVNQPKEITDVLPQNSYEHTCSFVQLKSMKDKSCLILGGRQSAFEWAALLADAGAKAVSLAYRHDTPAFSEADWSWVNKLVNAIPDNPAWYRQLTDEGKSKVSYDLWAEGRLKLEPWLKDRISKPHVHLFPNTRVAAAQMLSDGQVKVEFDTQQSIVVDKIILATGYKSAVENIPFLKAGNILSELAAQNGFPELDETFQTSVSGLFITSLAAGHSFGPFFGFTVAVRAAAIQIGRGLELNINLKID